MLCEILGCIGIQVRRHQKRLGGNAADVEAGATKPLARLHHRDVHAELGGTNGGHVAAGTGTEDYEVVRGISHGHCGPSESRASCALSTVLNVQQQPVGGLDAFFDADEEGHGLAAIDQAVIVREGDIHHRADDDG